MPRMTDEEFLTLNPWKVEIPNTARAAYAARVFPSVLAEARRARAAEAALLQALRAVEFGSCDGCGSGHMCAECSKDNGSCSREDYWTGYETHKPGCIVAIAIMAAEDGT